MGLAENITLPPPVTTGGMPLHQALSERKTIREIAETPFTPQELSNLLWAANGITRPDGRRTAPTARNAQEIELYVMLESGVYLYDKDGKQLTQVLKGDIRTMAGTQPFSWTSPVNIIFVANYAKQTWDISPEKKKQYASVDSGFIGQNIYLYCASTGLATVFRGMLDTDALHKKLELSKEKEVLYAQSIGHIAPPTPEEKEK